MPAIEKIQRIKKPRKPKKPKKPKRVGPSVRLIDAAPIRKGSSPKALASPSEKARARLGTQKKPLSERLTKLASGLPANSGIAGGAIQGAAIGATIGEGISEALSKASMKRKVKKNEKNEKKET